MELLGTSKVSTDNKITVIKNVVKSLQLTQGDMIVFYKSDNGDVVIKKGILKIE